MEPFEDILSRAEETLRGWFCKKDSRSTLEAVSYTHLPHFALVFPRDLL